MIELLSCCHRYTALVRTGKYQLHFLGSSAFLVGSEACWRGWDSSPSLRSQHESEHVLRGDAATAEAVMAGGTGGEDRDSELDTSRCLVLRPPRAAYDLEPGHRSRP